MKEFDFEELDRAVNSLMGDVKKSDTPQSAASAVSLPQTTTSTAPVEPVVTSPPETTLDITPSSLPISTEDSPTPPPLSPAPLPTRPSTPILPPRRASGRFMDVVHPSSDMTSSPSPAPSSSRQGNTLQPVTMSEEVKQPSGPVIDIMAPVASQPVEALKPVIPDEPTASDESINKKPADSSAPSEPWSSPFLPDTQVEKRPLGGSLPENPGTGLSEAIAAELNKEHPLEETSETPQVASEPDKEPVTATEPSLDDQSTKSEPATEVSSTPPVDSQLAPEVEAAVLPAELNNDLVAIESGQKSTLFENEESSAGSFESASNTSSSSAPAIISTGSIPPQYNEQPSSGDATHTPIYDNEAAHQTLTHPAKKKKSWVLVILIVAILVVGGGLGAAAYFLGLV